MAIIYGRVVDHLGRAVPGVSLYYVSIPQGTEATAPPGNEHRTADISRLSNEQGMFDLTVKVPGRYVIGARSGQDEKGEVIVDVEGEGPVTVEIRVLRQGEP